MTAVLTAQDGTAIVADGSAWVAPADACDLRVLDQIRGPVLDVGCGPGRHVVALAVRGETVLGIDISGPALAIARSNGAAVLRRSVFDPLPGNGRWRSILLFDGNIGIGADPVRLLRRCADLLAADGSMLIEVVGDVGDVGGATSPVIQSVRLECTEGAGPWFPWVTVDRAGTIAAAEEAGLHLTGEWFDNGRQFLRWSR